MKQLDGFDIEDALAELRYSSSDVVLEEYREVEGGFAKVLLGSKESDPVVKFPHDQSSASGRLLRMEVDIMSRLAAAGSLPLVVPVVLSSSLKSRPYYYAMDKAPGTVLTRQQTRGLNESEQQSLGSAVGAFVAHMGQVLPIDYYNRKYGTMRPRVYDRYKSRDVFYNRADLLKQMGYVALSSVLAKAISSISSTDEDPAARQVISDDIHSGNLSFDSDDGLCHPVGVFDFGLTKLGSVPRELRHMRILSRIASDSAIMTYQEATGSEISSGAVDAWAGFQLVTALSAFVVCRNIQGIGYSLPALHDLYPDHDWTEIHRIMPPPSRSV